jgi:hypothetical protein
MEAALPTLREAVVRSGRRRRAARGVLVAACVLWTVGLGAWAGVLALRAGETEGTRAPGGAVAPTPRVMAREDAAAVDVMPEAGVALPASRVRVGIVVTDPGVAERMMVREGATRVQRMGDAELAAALKEAGLPRGVLRIGGETMWEGELLASGSR